MSSPATDDTGATPKAQSAVKACQFCRVRKIKCDTKRPTCGSCSANGRTCVYVLEPPKKRPSKAIIHAIQRERDDLQNVLISLKHATSQERDATLSNLQVYNGTVQLPLPSPPKTGQSRNGEGGTPFEISSATTHLGKDDPRPWPSPEGLSLIPPSPIAGQPASRLPSTLERLLSQDAVETNAEAVPEHLRFQLTANAALQLQKEHTLRRLEFIRGVPAELALHLLDLHWNRQHHTFHLTYRPLLMRELMEGGSYCTDFLLNAIFAGSSKFSERIEVNNDQRFFQRCDELLSEQSLLTRSSIPTIIGLLLLGTTFNAKGSSSKGWLYTGYAFRMVYDLGLHLDIKETPDNAEGVEVRRRVFWGAFIIDKLQSLYHGRSVCIELRDANVSRNFMDTIEELELWSPYLDPKVPNSISNTQQKTPAPIYSITTFQHFCTLAMIMSRVITTFYVVGSSVDNTHGKLDSIDHSLSSWYTNLPRHLIFEPSSNAPAQSQNIPSPNVIILLTTYNALVILLHRPFITISDLRSTSIPAMSWRKCTAAARNITNLVVAYQSTYPLRRASYLLSYSVYVACTIHVRNRATEESSGTEADKHSSPLLTCLRFLDMLSRPNGGVAELANIIRRLMMDNGMSAIEDMSPNYTGSRTIHEPVASSFLDPSLGFSDFGQLDDLTGFETISNDLLFGFMSDSYLNTTV